MIKDRSGATLVGLFVLFLSILGLLWVLFAVKVRAATTYPSPSGFVNDFSHVLTNQEQNQLELKLQSFQKQTTDEIAVVTVDTTDPLSAQEYSMNLADQWKPGVKGKDNGVILLLAIHDHKDFIQVGRGLEGNLTDIQASEILQHMTPDLKQGAYGKAIDLGTDEIMSAISATPSAVASASAQTLDGSSTMFMIVVGVFLLIILVAGASMFLAGVPSDSDDDDSDSYSARASSMLGTASLAGLSGSSSSSDDNDDSSSSSGFGGWGSGGGSDSGGSFGGFSGGSFSGGGAGGSW